VTNAARHHETPLKMTLEKERKKRFLTPKEVLKAEKLADEWRLKLYEISLEDFLKAYGVKPIYRDLWHLAENCVDARRCYRMLVYMRLAGREWDIELVEKAVKLAVDMDIFIALVYRGHEEVKRLI